MIIRTKVEFDAAHLQPQDPGKCKRLHGHRYVAYLDVEGPIDPDTGYVIEYGRFKRLLKKHIIPDHLTLNTKESLASIGVIVPDEHIWEHAIDVPSIENITKHMGELCTQTDQEFVAAIYPAKVIRITLWETPNFAATWNA